MPQIASQRISISKNFRGGNTSGSPQETRGHSGLLPQTINPGKNPGIISVQSDLNIWDHLLFEGGPLISDGRSDRNIPFHLTKLLSPVPLFCILLARTITKRSGGLGRAGETGMYRSIGRVEFPKFLTTIFDEWKAPNTLRS